MWNYTTAELDQPDYYQTSSDSGQGLVLILEEVGQRVHETRE